MSGGCPGRDQDQEDLDWQDEEPVHGSSPFALVDVPRWFWLPDSTQSAGQV